MRHIQLRFCAGCGQVFDEIQPKDGQPQWMDAHAYLTKYGFHWEDLDRMDDACPPCARVFAIGVIGPEGCSEEPKAYVLVNNRSEGNAPLTVQALSDLLVNEV